MSVKTALFLFLLPTGFVLGWWAAPTSRGIPLERREKRTERESDTIKVSASAANSVHVAVAASVPADLEKTVRGVPFSFLKQIYLERQDQEWAKADQRYSRIPPEDEQGQKKQTEELFNLFQKNSNGASFFSATTEWTFRGGKSVPVTLLAQFYSSRTADVSSTQADASLATQGSELCYTATVYFKVGLAEGGHYSSAGTGSCLRWPTIREGRPYVLFDSYAKQMTPLFDKFTAPLPGFGSDGDVDPEWYDANRSSWTALSRLRWDAISREDYLRVESDLQLDTDHR